MSNEVLLLSIFFYLLALLHLGRVRLVSHVDGPKQDPPLGNGDISTFALQSSHSENVEESSGVQHISLRCKKR